MSPSEKIKILFYLENETIILAEVKRTDLKNETDKSKIFFWLQIHKLSGKIEKLTFVSMKSEKETEERVFQEGKLTFNTQTGLFSQKNRQPQKLQNKSGSLFPPMQRQQIAQFLKI